ncbi:nicotinamide N-methyltransferase-like [Pyxicephalus adspersus]
MEAWKNKGRVAIDWSHASQFAEELGINSAKWKEKEDILRSKIKNISKIDFNQEHPADLSVLPKADCVISLYVMHNISESPDSFYRSIQTLASFMKPDGVLLLFGGYNASFYMVGENKFFPLPITQDMLMEALDRAGLTILCYETLQSKVRSSSIHYERLFFVKAGKLRKSLENNCNW